MEIFERFGYMRSIFKCWVLDYTKRRLNYSLRMINQTCIIFFFFFQRRRFLSTNFTFSSSYAVLGFKFHSTVYTWMYGVHQAFIIISQRWTCKFSTKNTAMALSISLGDCVWNLWQFCSLVSAVNCGWSIFTHTCSNFSWARDSVHFARIPRTGWIWRSQGSRWTVGALLKQYKLWKYSSGKFEKVSILFHLHCKEFHFPFRYESVALARVKNAHCNFEVTPSIENHFIFRNNEITRMNQIKLLVISKFWLKECKLLSYSDHQFQGYLVNLNLIVKVVPRVMTTFLSQISEPMLVTKVWIRVSWYPRALSRSQKAFDQQQLWMLHGKCFSNKEVENQVNLLKGTERYKTIISSFFSFSQTMRAVFLINHIR